MNLIQLQERLKDLPMPAIIQYANGASPQVPPFMALNELSRRKKMQEAAAAEQAQQMAGAPSIKEQLEQTAGLMSLQQPQQVQQQPMPQQMPQAMPQAMPQQAPVQMAEGGIASIPVPDDMYEGLEYATGGIVAFNGQDQSFVETDTGFYQLRDEVPGQEEIDESKLTPMQRMYLREVRRRRQEPSLEDRRRQFGLPDQAPDTTAAMRADYERRLKDIQASDNLVDRILNLQVGRFGSGTLGASVANYEKTKAARIDEIRRLQAAAEDQKKQAEVAYQENRFKEFETARNAAQNFELDAIMKMSTLAKDEAQIKQAEATAKSAGRTPYMEQVYADLKSNDPARIAAARVALGQAKTGEITDEDAIKEWGKLGFRDKSELAKMNPPVTNAMEYKAYLMRQKAAIQSGEPPKVTGNRPPISSFQR